MAVRPSRGTWLLTTITATVIALTGCSSGAASSTGSSSSGGTADTAKAAQLTEPYVGKASAFPVDEPLAKRPSADTTIAYLQCSTPFCAIFAGLLQSATASLGVDLAVTKADASASGLQTAAETIISQAPDAVIVAGTDPSAIKNQLAELDSMKIPVLSNGAIDGAQHGIDVSFNDTAAMQVVGSTLAAWAVQQKGSEANIVFYGTPELAFSGQIQEAFVSTVQELCPGCAVRTEDVPVATIGSTAPAQVVSDLQANPGTNTAVFATEEAATGLPAQLRVAGLSSQVAVNGFGATPAQLQEISSGALAGSLAVDVPVIMWTLVDAAARLVTGQQLTAGEESGIPPLELVDAKSLQGKDVSNGYSAYPDVADRFATLWSGSSAD